MSADRVAALGLDVGRRRIGVAGCDGTGLIATGLMTLRRSAFAEDVAAFKKIVKERRVNILVIGMPYTLTEGGEGTQAKQTRRYGEGLARALNLPVEYVDERLSSLEAKEQLRAEGRSPTADKGLIDRRAAAIILQRWLDQRRGTF